MDWDPLIKAAKAAYDNAYAPYSGYQVGSALRTSDGTVHAGCNVENRSFGATICAERSAVTRAVGDGSLRVEAIVVITSSDPPGPPCGMCLQVLAEFSDPDLPILLISTSGTRQEHCLRDFHPHPFELPPDGLGRFSKR